MQSIIWNHRIIPANSTCVSVRDRGFRYGDGIFETLSVYNGVPYQYGWHIQRLHKGLEAIKIHIDLQQLRSECAALLVTNQVNTGLLRIYITRSEGGSGYMPATPAGIPNLLIETFDTPPRSGVPLSLWLSTYEKITPRALPIHYKLAQGLQSTLARIEAQENNCHDALLLNAQHYICETSCANIFWYKNDTLYTPSLSCGILEGSMRAAIMRLSPYPLRHVMATLEEIADANAVFITNAVSKVLPVEKLLPSGLTWESAPIAHYFYNLILSDIEKYTNQQPWT